MDSKKSYEAPEIEVILFDREDIVRTSNPDTRTPSMPASVGFSLY